MTMRFVEDRAGLGAKADRADDSPEAALKLTEQLFEMAVDDLSIALDGVRQGDFEALKQGKAAVKALAEMSKQVLEERRNVDKLRKQIAGIATGNRALDLDAARAEIGRRLACLRHARGD